MKSMRNVVKAAALESEIVHCRTLFSGCDLVEVPCSSLDTESLNLLGVRGGSFDARFCIAIACTNHSHIQTLNWCMDHASTPLVLMHDASDCMSPQCTRRCDHTAAWPPQPATCETVWSMHGVLIPCQLTGTIRRSTAVRLKVRQYQPSVTFLVYIRQWRLQ